MRRTRKKPTDCYAKFLSETEFRFCWYCGRSASQRPSWWGADFFIERAHIVSSPIVEDRRVVVLLCSACHFACHNSNVFGYTLPVPTVEHMLWLKRTFDREYYDREFMQKFSVKRLLSCIGPPKVVMEEFASRHGSYPNAETGSGQ